MAAETEQPSGSRRMGFVVRHFQACVTAVSFLTRVPVGAWSVTRDPVQLRHSTGYFPFVATLIGAFTAGIVLCGMYLWPIWLAVIVALAAEAILTGAFHEDAVADFFDAFGGGWTRDDVLRILKDSRIGTYGTLALLFAVALRTGATILIVDQFTAAGWQHWMVAIIAGSVIGRWVIVLCMWRMPPVAGRESLSKDIGQRLGAGDVFLATLWALPAMLAFSWLFPLRSILAVILLVAVILIFLRTVRRKLGGITGDCLGCICYVSQVVVLLSVTARIDWLPWIIQN